MSALLSLALAPSFQRIGVASTACLARYQVSATTATPLSPTLTTFLTPGIFIATLASNDSTVPPTTGQSRIAALSMPGSFKSMP